MLTNKLKFVYLSKMGNHPKNVRFLCVKTGELHVRQMCESPRKL